MIPRKQILTMTIAGCSLLSAMGQSVSIKQQETETSALTVVERIEESSLGNVTIDIPQNILQEILKERKEPQHREETLKPGINKLSGFRIQVFSDGRNQQSLESRARARGNAIVAKFPKYRGQVYSHSSSPNWYTRVGNFRTQAEASAALAELKRAFPQFSSEMRVVKSKIVVIK